MAASGEKRTRRKPLTAPSATIPGIEPSTTDATPPLPGLPGATVPARGARRTTAKPAEVKTPTVAPAVTPDLPVAAPVAPVAMAEPVQATAPVVEAAVKVADTAVPEAVSAAGDVAETATRAADDATQTLANAAQDTADTVASRLAETPELAPEASNTIELAARAAIAQQETTIMDTVQNTAEKTQAFFADANERTKGAMEKGAKFFQEMTEFGKGNVEAVVESSKIAARGFETMGQDTAAYLKTSFEDASQALRTLATIKSPTELMKFQADYLRSSFDAMVAQTSRGAEASLKLAGEVAQPISNRVAVAAEKMKVSA